jgi:tetratricopeptide (TPR) repeat protein
VRLAPSVCGAFVATLTIVFTSSLLRAADDDAFATGISLLVRDDFKGAVAAFEQVITAKPDVPEGYILLALALDGSGDREALIKVRRQVWERDLDPQTPTEEMRLLDQKLALGLELNPRTSEGRYFEALLNYRLGHFETALQILQSLQAERPYDWADFNLIGSTYLRLARFTEARSALEKALALSREHADTHYKVGTVQLATGDAAGASEVLETAVRLRSNFPAAHAALGVAQLQLGRFAAARQALEKGTSVGPTVFLYLGMANERLGEFHRALEAYQHAIESDPSFYGGHLRRGSLLLKRGKPAEAQRHLLRAVELRPALPEAHLSLAHAYLEQGQVPSAQESLERARSQATAQSASFHYRLGQLFGALGRHKEARDAFAKAVAKDGTNVTYHEKLATTLQQMGDHAGAINSLRAALKVFPNRPELNYLLGFNQYESRQFQEALQAFKTAIRLEPDEAKYHHFAGLSHAALEEDERAMTAFQDAVAVDRKHLWSHQQMGLLRLKAGAVQEAEAVFSKVLEIDPAYAPAWYRLGKIYYERKDNERALELLEKARQLDPDWEDTYFLLGTLYTRRGEQQKAAKTLDIFRAKKNKVQAQRQELLRNKIEKFHSEFQLKVQPGPRKRLSQ